MTAVPALVGPGLVLAEVAVERRRSEMTGTRLRRETAVTALLRPSPELLLSMRAAVEAAGMTVLLAGMAVRAVLVVVVQGLGLVMAQMGLMVSAAVVVVVV